MPVERHWDGDTALLEYQELLERPGTNADVNAEQRFRELINRYAGLAATSTLQLALHAYDESIRFKASKALVDWKIRLMALESTKDPLSELIEDLTSNDENDRGASEDEADAPASGEFASVVSFEGVVSLGSEEIVDGELVQDAPAPGNSQGTSALLGASNVAAIDAGAGAITSSPGANAGPASPDDKCDCPDGNCERRHA